MRKFALIGVFTAFAAASTDVQAQQAHDPEHEGTALAFGAHHPTESFGLHSPIDYFELVALASDEDVLTSEGDFSLEDVVQSDGDISFEEIVQPDGDFSFEEIVQSEGDFSFEEFVQPDEDFSFEEIVQPDGDFSFEELVQSEGDSSVEDVVSSENDMDESGTTNDGQFENDDAGEDVVTTPEPSSAILLLTGIVGVGAVARRRRSKV